jgi:N-acetylmuramoyl-L-alanine amidase
MDLGQTVGYDFAEKKLTVTVGDKTAQKMKSDGWNVHYDSELGHFVTIQMVES